ncbi:NAD(P)/FAD-dependent oxidoreductase [Variovorax sp. J22G21]|uniref:FAD/NAD(P)-dependent oxidoreductase n=1 Tax=Variovorax fucosicus TaxID=3053517 RepID=UPI002577572A|nr:MULTISPECIES: NAD(P)/FAD-dependent oxidoreductase [unclassified Variovorax]MDM0040648.1 NAD(P)/FAD-dependent oxidoreductase [Variovorax sp. J22R193]MDM0062021.1 NAD(P)/FAD-dependent oxidoreductase [Variovorax sp. J22G21]
MVEGVGHAVDLLVIGAGPAGARAALRAHACGLKVLLVDENVDAGGQVYRPLPVGFSRSAGAPRSKEARAGDDLRAALRNAGVDCRFGHKVWNIGTDLRTDLIGPDGSASWQPRALLVATGTTERVVPFEGWTLPGVMGLAAATILLKSQNMLPGRRTLVAGSGPLLLAVADGILKAGGAVAAVVDLASRAEWLRALPALAGRPDLLWRGLQWQAKLRLAGVPVLYRHGVHAAEATDDGLRVHVQPVDATGRPLADGARRTIEANCLTVGHGLVPATDVTRLLRARHRYAAERGGWIAETDEDGRTSVAGVYLAGDGAGIAGAAAAGAHGELAALACAADLGRIGKAAHANERAGLLRAWTRPARFGHAMAGLMALREGAVAGIAGSTIVCRCEDVTRAEIDAAAREGARDLNQLKAWTRCGMGPCQGRSCGDVTGALLAPHAGSREAVGCFTGRAPLRPVSLAEVAGDYTYADIPIPKAAPL